LHGDQILELRFIAFYWVVLCAGALFVEVRIKNANLRDLRDGQFVTRGGATDGFGSGPVIDAEGPLTIGGNVGMDPGDAILGIVVDDGAA